LSQRREKSKSDREVFLDFVKKISEQEDADPKIQRVINEHFWELIDGEDKQQEEGKPS